MQRFAFAVLSLAALAACDPPVPDSGAGVINTGAGVGFGSYEDYQAQREAELIANAPGATAGIDPQSVSGEDVASTGLGAPADPTGQFADEALAVVTGAGPAVNNEVGISAENDFSAVSNQRSIEQDAARVAANREAYVEIQPTALPQRPSGSGSSLVEFALSTTNARGEPLYSRLIPGAEARAARNCAKYPSPDLAQEDFLKNGGPKRNAKGLDPDGDGFACAWDPAPFRLAAGR